MYGCLDNKNVSLDNTWKWGSNGGIIYSSHHILKKKKTIKDMGHKRGSGVLKTDIKPPPERESTAFVWKYTQVYWYLREPYIGKCLKVRAEYINNFHSSITTAKPCNSKTGKGFK